MKISDVVNLIAIILGPIVAIIVGQMLQAKNELRNDKMKVFKTLMVSRIYDWTTPEMVDALNAIDIVFANDEKVRAAWRDLFDKYNVSSFDEAQKNKIINARYKLLEEMAKSLGYKEKITWDIIQNPYIPIGLQNQIATQQKSQQAYMDILSAMKNNIPHEWK